MNEAGAGAAWPTVSVGVDRVWFWVIEKGEFLHSDAELETFKPARLMSISAAQASKFYEQVVHDRKVFTLEDPEGFLVFPIRDIEVIPFWSSLSRVENIHSTMPEYAKYSIHTKPFGEFYEETLPWLEELQIHIGVNWSGERLSGYDVPVNELRVSLDYWMEKR